MFIFIVIVTFLILAISSYKFFNKEHANFKNSLTIINEVRNIVEKACKEETNKLGYEFWSHHILIVVKYGKILAEKLDADLEIVELAALLHDYAQIKNIGPSEEHHIYGAKEAEKILNRYNYPQEKIAQIKQCILAHRSSVNVKHEIVESRCLASADAMSHIDQVIFLLYYTYKTKKLKMQDGKKWVKKTIERDWNNKLCLIGKEIIKEKYYCAKKVLE